MRAEGCCMLSFFIPLLHKQSLNMLSGSKAQPEFFVTLLDFSYIGNAAKGLHVLYTKIAGSYFNL